MRNENQHIHMIIQHVEKNLPFALDTKILSEMGYVSHAKLYRDFYCITGHSVKEYIRKRRLSNALAMIKASELSLADIACSCGYSSQQALCRAVKDALHMTPLEYKNSDTYYFYPAFCGTSGKPISVTSETIPETQCIKFFHPRFMGIERAAVAYFLSLYPEYKGRIFGRNGKQKGSLSCYELYLSDADHVIDKLEQSDFVIHEKYPAITQTFATTMVKNNDNMINEAWDYIYFEWLSKSMFEICNPNAIPSGLDSYFEEYTLKQGFVSKLKLYLPIKKREDYIKITLEECESICFLVSSASGAKAEQTSAKAVIGYLSEHYPYIIKNTKEFYIQKDANKCTSGVKINNDICISDDSSLINICTSKGLYVVLHSNFLGDYWNYRDILLSWISENGLYAQKEDAFAIFDANESYDNPKMKMYCKLNSIQNDNTGKV